LAADLRTGLERLGDVTIHDEGKQHCGIVTFQVKGEAPNETAARLAARSMNVSVSIRSYAQLDFGARGIDALTRASVHYFNTEGEVDRFVMAVGDSH